MTLDDILNSLFPRGSAIERRGPVLTGWASYSDRAGEQPVAVIGIVDGVSLAPQHMILLAEHVLSVIARNEGTPILVLADTEGQIMSRHAEMIGLNEYCAHLAKCLRLASHCGHATIGLEYGKAAAGALLATALATDMFVAIGTAEPAVMDLPSIARITKLPLERLKDIAKSAPVFAPGLQPLFETGAIASIWDEKEPLSEQLAAALADVEEYDIRDRLGAKRGGRKCAAYVADRVVTALETAR